MWGGMPDLQRYWSWPASRAAEPTVSTHAVFAGEAFDLALRDILALRAAWSAKHNGMMLAADGPSLLTLGDLGFAA